MGVTSSVSGGTYGAGIGAGIICPAGRTLGHTAWETGGNPKDGAGCERRRDQLGIRKRGALHLRQPQPSRQGRKSKGGNDRQADKGCPKRQGDKRWVGDIVHQRAACIQGHQHKVDTGRKGHTHQTERLRLQGPDIRCHASGLWS
jgi:hypothetical protein